MRKYAAWTDITHCRSRFKQQGADRGVWGAKYSKPVTHDDQGAQTVASQLSSNEKGKKTRARKHRSQPSLVDSDVPLTSPLVLALVSNQQDGADCLCTVTTAFMVCPVI